MRTFKNGDGMVLTYLEMALYSLNSGGVIERGELTQSLVDEIALATNEPPERVAQTIDLLVKARVAELDGDRLCLTEMAKFMGSESGSTTRSQKCRERARQNNETPHGVFCNAKTLQSVATATHDTVASATTDIEKDIIQK